MIRSTAIVGIILSLTACDIGTSYTGSYLGGDSTALFQLNIVETTDEQISGTVSFSTLDYKEGKLETVTTGLTGVRDGSSINLLAANGNGGSMNLVGNGSKLIWNVPNTGQSVEFIGATQAQYQKRLLKLSQQLNGNDVGTLPSNF